MTSPVIFACTYGKQMSECLWNKAHIKSHGCVHTATTNTQPGQIELNHIGLKKKRRRMQQLRVKLITSVLTFFQSLLLFMSTPINYMCLQVLGCAWHVYACVHKIPSVRGNARPNPKMREFMAESCQGSWLIWPSLKSSIYNQLLHIFWPNESSDQLKPFHFQPPVIF